MIDRQLLDLIEQMKLSSPETKGLPIADRMKQLNRLHDLARQGEGFFARKILDATAGYSTILLALAVGSAKKNPEQANNMLERDIKKIAGICNTEFRTRVDQLVGMGGVPDSFAKPLLACKGMNDLLFANSPEEREAILATMRHDPVFLKVLNENRAEANAFLRGCIEDKPELLIKLMGNRLGQNFLINPALVVPPAKPIVAPEPMAKQPIEPASNQEEKAKPAAPVAPKLNLADLEDKRFAAFHCPITKGIIKGDVVKVKSGDKFHYFDAHALKKALQYAAFNPITNAPMTFKEAIPATDEYRKKLFLKYKGELVVKGKMKPADADKQVEAMGMEFDRLAAAEKTAEEKVKSQEPFDAFKAITDPTKIDDVKKAIEKDPGLLAAHSPEHHKSTLLISVLYQARYSGDASTRQKNLELAKFIVEKITDPKLLNNERDADGNTAAHRAVWYGFAEIAKSLIEKGANPGLRNGRQKTVLDDVLKSPTLSQQEKAGLTSLCFEKAELGAKVKADLSAAGPAIAPPTKSPKM